MDKILAIFKKEMRGFLFNPNFLVVCALFTVILSWVYPITLGQFAQNLHSYVYQMQAPKQQLNIHYAVFLKELSYLNLMLILVVPALTMRLFAEEKKMRTADLLMTSPITSAQIVTGKYLAVLGALVIVVGLAFLYPAMTGLFAKLNWTTLSIAFIGLYFVGAVYGAMNLFCSSLTESAIVAYVMAVILNISIWFIGMGAEVVEGPAARQIFEHISLNGHLSNLVEGTVRTNSLVFFGSVIFLFAYLAERVVESSRWR
jgi:ABC-2 type transport system permease protein